MYGSNAQVFVWVGSGIIDGASRQLGDVKRTGGQHHGSQAHGERHAVWNVSVDGQSDGGGSDGGSDGSPDSDAMHSQYTRSVDCGRTDGATWEYADSEQLRQADVYVGRSD